jgi:Fe2+ transport system protein FeoA
MNVLQSPLTAAQLKEKESRTVLSFQDDYLAGRFISMGILPGALLKVIRIAPLQGGFYVKIDGHNVVLRKKEAASIVVA